MPCSYIMIVISTTSPRSRPVCARGRSSRLSWVPNSRNLDGVLTRHLCGTTDRGWRLTYRPYFWRRLSQISPRFGPWRLPGAGSGGSTVLRRGTAVSLSPPFPVTWRARPVVGSARRPQRPRRRRRRRWGGRGRRRGRGRQGASGGVVLVGRSAWEARVCGGGHGGHRSPPVWCVRNSA